MYQIERDIRDSGPVVWQNSFEDLEYLTFPMLEGTGKVKHLFSTRLGGVSDGIFSSMNLSYQRGDKPENVLANYKKIGSVLGTAPENMVRSSQTHTTNIRLVTASDKGNGVVKHSEFSDVDGLVTDEKGIVLVTSYADCVPLYFVDPVKEAIGLAHSGWRGTAGKMGAQMVERMQHCFGSDPHDIYAAIGPSICRDCYEVGEDVAENFRELDADALFYREELREIGMYRPETGGKVINPGKTAGKYQLDLWLANALILRMAGIAAEKISITDICTCHNPGYLFSHRASKGQRGALCAFLMLKES